MTESDRRDPRKIEGISKKRLLDDVFKIDEVVVRHEKFDGTMSDEKRILVFERGDAAAALLYNPYERKVILINQFRLPTFGKQGSMGWLTETPAGIIAKDMEETAEECILREIKEETGFQVTRLTPVATFFSSPGGSSELIHLFYAEVRTADRITTGGGAERDQEDIKLEEYPLQLFLQMLANREFLDPKVIIAGQWLRDRQSRIQARPSSSEARLYRLKASPGTPGHGKMIGYITGDIANVQDIDVWVNPENTDMIMDRFFGRSISAAIRFLGARKYPGTQRVEKDTIGEALRQEMGGAPFVKPAYVIPTTSGELAKTNNVQRIFHVAAAFGQIGDTGPTSDVHGPVGKGLTTNLKTLEQCVINVLDEMDRAAQWPAGLRLEPYRSVIFPMMGTGEGGLFVEEVAERLVAKTIEYFEKRPKTFVQSVYFLAYSAADQSILEEILQDHFGEKLEKVQ